MNGIKAFEAAARSGSFAKAADELHVTPAAVSRMVHLLEARLAVTLFERKANRLAPTPAGRAYQAGLTQLFDQLAALTDQVTAMGSASPPVAKRTSMSGAAFWKSASRGISQRIANVGPTPTVSTRALPIAVT